MELLKKTAAGSPDRLPIMHNEVWLWTGDPFPKNWFVLTEVGSATQEGWVEMLTQGAWVEV